MLESSRQYDSNKWSNIGNGEEIKQVVSVEDTFTHLIWSSDLRMCFMNDNVVYYKQFL